MSKRDSNAGTWMVQCLHNELDKMHQDLDIEVLLTKMQCAVHNHTSFLGNGQTPEARIFPCRKFTFLKYDDMNLDE
jgi:hypothetical protein